MVTISGILTDGAGQIINDCTIELYAKKTTSNVLTQTQAFTVANDGRYSMNVLPCEYDVSLIINGFPKKRIGTISVYSDSLNGTLNDYLINPEETDLTPDFLKQVFDARDVAKKSATQATNSATAAKTSETNAKSFADEAKISADNADNNAQIAVKSAVTATEAASTAVTSSDTAKSYADNARDSATASSQSASAASQSEQNSKTSETNAQLSASEAKASADNAKSWASTVDHSNFIKKTGEDNQSINGSLDVKVITEQDQRVYSPNNKPDADTVGALPATRIVKNDVPTYSVGSSVVFKDTIGEFRLMPFRAGELPFGWYFRNGDNYLLNSPQGQALNRLSDNYKRDHQITIKTINGQQYINVPSAFAPDGRGYFERAIDGTTRQVGSTEGDAIRDIWGHFDTGVVDNHDSYARGAFAGSNAINPNGGAFQPAREWMAWGYEFFASRVVPTANENRPLNIGLTPVIYLGV